MADAQMLYTKTPDLLDLLVVDLAEILQILEELLNLQIVLLGKESSIVLHSLHLPIILEPLNEALVVKLSLLLDNLLGGEEGDDAVALGGDFGVLIKVVYNLTSLVFLGKFFAGHLVTTQVVCENI